MTDLPTPSSVSIYQVDICNAGDADGIIKATFKRPKSTPLLVGAKAAAAINSGISKALKHIGPLLESPPSEQAEWAAKLAAALRTALKLLSSSATPTVPPSPNDLTNNFLRLFNASGGPSPEIADVLEQRGLLADALEDHGLLDGEGTVSARQRGTLMMAKTTEIALVGVWLAYALAEDTDKAWRKKLRGRSDRRRLTRFSRDG